MALSFREAADIAWTALLDEVGEAHIPTCREIGIIDSFTSKEGKSDAEAHWRIVFLDMIYLCEPPWDQVVGRVWVDKRTGHCNVWVNEDYNPIPSDFTIGAKARLAARGLCSG